MTQNSIHKIKARDEVEGRGVGSALVKKLVKRGAEIWILKAVPWAAPACVLPGPKG